MILNVQFRDKDGNSVTPTRRAERLTLEAEGLTDLDLLAALAATGGTTSAAVRAVVDRMRAEGVGA